MSFPVDDDELLMTMPLREECGKGAKRREDIKFDDRRFQWERNQVDGRKANGVLLVVDGQGYSPNLILGSLWSGS